MRDEKKNTLLIVPGARQNVPSFSFSENSKQTRVLYSRINGSSQFIASQQTHNMPRKSIKTKNVSVCTAICFQDKKAQEYIL